jgi:hypothetical protein
MIPSLIKEIVENGIEVTIKEFKGSIVYDVNTGAKSQLYLEQAENGDWTAYMRYDETEVLYDPVEFIDICYLVKRCMHGRDYCNPIWVKAMKEEGVIKEIVETKITYR